MGSRNTRPKIQAQRSVPALIDIGYVTYEAVGAAVSINAKLRTYVATFEQRHEPVQMAACSTAHEGAALIHEIDLVFVWEVFHAGRCAPEQTRRAKPCSHLQRPLAYTAVSDYEIFTQVPQSPPHTWLKRPLCHSPLDILGYSGRKAGGGSFSDERSLAPSYVRNIRT